MRKSLSKINRMTVILIVASVIVIAGCGKKKIVEKVAQEATTVSRAQQSQEKNESKNTEENSVTAAVQDNNNGAIQTDVSELEDRKQQVSEEYAEEQRTEEQKISAADHTAAITETEAATSAPAVTEEWTQAPDSTEPQPAHGVAVGTKTLEVVFHGRNKELNPQNVARGDLNGAPIHTEYIEYPVDAYGEPVEAIYDTEQDCCYIPDDSGFETYIVTAYGFFDGKVANKEVDLRKYMKNGKVDVYMCWIDCTA